MKCPYCGELHPDRAQFCPKTGRRMIAAAPAAQKGPPWVTLLVAGGLVVVLGVLWTYFGDRFAVPDQLGAVEINRTTTTTGLVLEGPVEQPTEPAPAAAASKAPTTPPASTPTLPPTTTPWPTLTLTQPPTAAPTQTSIPAVTTVNPKDQAVIIYIPAGEFLMGSEPGSDPYFWGSEGSSHKVLLDGFWIYQIEVTNAMYQACVDQKACPIPAKNRSATREDYFGSPSYANYPVVFVNWTLAQSYCVWAGAKLPSEAQWEKAARGTDARLFPWLGDYNDTQANLCDTNCSNSVRMTEYDDGYRDSSPVGNFPAGASVYGGLDMGGNVWEWVQDWFQEGYYQSSPMENPLGPASSKYRVVRGGSFDNALDGVRAVTRYAIRPDIALETVGFRCAVKD